MLSNLQYLMDTCYLHHLRHFSCSGDGPNKSWLKSSTILISTNPSLDFSPYRYGELIGIITPFPPTQIEILQWVIIGILAIVRRLYATNFKENSPICVAWYSISCLFSSHSLQIYCRFKKKIVCYKFFRMCLFYSITYTCRVENHEIINFLFQRFFIVLCVTCVCDHSFAL